MTRRSEGVPAALWLALGFIGGVLCSLGAWLVYDLVRPPQPPTVSATPLAVPTAPPCIPTAPPATPEPEPSPTLAPTPARVRPTPVAKATPTPGPATPHPDLARRLDEGDKALAAGHAEAAQAAYEQALRLDPSSAPAQAGRTRAAGLLLALRRRFVAEVTDSDGAGVGRGLSGFEPGDVVVKKEPQVPAGIEFEMRPARLKPGDAYTLRLYLTNAGKKTVKVRSLRVALTVNGARSQSEPQPLAAEAKRGQRIELLTLSGKWSATRDWACEVTVMAEHGDVYGRRLVWR